MAAQRYTIYDKLGLLILAGVVALVLWNARQATRGAPVAAGTPLPPLDAVSWLNVPDGERVTTDGKFVVVDCWATWCGPCRAALPHLALAATHYRPLGVEFIGVTDETERDRKLIEGVIDSTPGFDWPVAYGGREFMVALDIRSIPTLILFGPDGKAVWSGVGSTGLEAALDSALAAAKR